LHWFQAKGNDELTDSCKNACEDIERSITDLMSYRELLDDRFTEFDGILTRVGLFYLANYVHPNCYTCILEIWQ
jgi:hypothetical protein